MWLTGYQLLLLLLLLLQARGCSRARCRCAGGQIVVASCTARSTSGHSQEPPSACAWPPPWPGDVRCRMRQFEPI